MRKRIISFLLATMLVIPCLLVFTACGKQNPGNTGGGGEMTRAEISATYKEIAGNTLEAFGYQNPFAPQAMAITIPDQKVETTDPHAIANIDNNAKTGAGIIYMISLLYENDAFVTTNGIAIFNATINMFGDDYEQNYVIKSSLDVPNNKVYIEAIITVGGSEQYSNAVLSYDFTAKELISFRFVSCLEFMNMGVDMELTADGRNMWYEAQTADDPVFIALVNMKNQFKTSAESVTPLTEDFSTECQTYFDVLQSVIKAEQSA